MILRDVFFRSSFQRITWCGLGCQIRPFNHWVGIAFTFISRKASLFRLAAVSSGEVLRTLVGRTLCGLRLPSSCAPIIAWLVTLVKGFSEIFFGFFCPSRFSAPTDPLRGSVDQTPRRFGRIIRTLVRHCYPPCLGGGAQTPRLPTFRAIASCAGSHWIPLGITLLRWSYCITLGRTCQGFFGIFLLGSRTHKRV